MKRLTRFQENISVKKATNYAIIINSLEILLILSVMTVLSLILGAMPIQAQAVTQSETSARA